MKVKLVFLFVVFTTVAYTSYSSNYLAGGDTVRKESIKQRFAIGGSFGYGKPFGLYGAAQNAPNLRYNDNMYADPGIHFDMNFNFQISGHWGIQAVGEGNVNRINNAFYYNMNGNPRLTGNGSYYLGEYLVGPFYSAVYNNGNIFEPRLLIGGVTIYSGQINLSDNGFYAGYIPMYSSFGIGAELGLKFKIHLTQKLYAVINIAFMCEFYDEEISSEQYYTGGGVLLPAGIISGGAGIEYKF